MEIKNFKDLYLKVFCCTPYLIGFISYVISNVQEISGILDAFAFLTLSAIILGIFVFGCFMSIKLVQSSIEYFGLPKNYIIITILCIIMSFLSRLILIFILAYAFPPEVSKTQTPFFF